MKRIARIFANTDGSGLMVLTRRRARDMHVASVLIWRPAGTTSTSPTNPSLIGA